MTQQYPDWRGGVGQYQNPWGGVGMYQYPNSGRPGDPPWATTPQSNGGGISPWMYPPGYSRGGAFDPNTQPGPYDPAYAAWAMRQAAPQGAQAQQQAYQQAVAAQWRPPNGTPVPSLGQPFQSQAPFTEYGAWNMQGVPPVSRTGFSGNLGPAWTPGSAQGRPPSWNAPQGAGPTGPGGAQGGAQNPNGGPWWTDPNGYGTFPGFDWNQVVPWGNVQYTPGGPSPFAGQPVGAWEDITNNLRTMGYLDQQAFNNAQQGVQNNQWDRTFGANQAQQGVQNSQWDRNFGANQAQNAFQNQLARDQYNTGVGQWDRNFNAQQGQQGWQNNFQQNEANRAADQWGQTFGANQAQQGWNNQFQTGRANAADSQWGQTFGANESQRGIENARNAALDQWNQAFSQAGFDWKKQQDAEQNRLQDQGQNLAAFGRRFGPNVSYM